MHGMRTAIALRGRLRQGRALQLPARRSPSRAGKGTGVKSPARPPIARPERPNEQDGNRPAAEDAVGHAAEDPSAEARSAVGGHHDEVGLRLALVLHDLARRVACPHRPLDVEPFERQVASRLHLEVLPGGLP